jgi:hypothetical protein
MPEVHNIEAAKAALAAAQTAHKNVLDEIKKAESAITESSPAAAVAAGVSLADAAAEHHRAHNTLAFLQDAREHAWQNVLTADAALKTALVHSQWAEKLDKAIAARIAAVEVHAQAVAARAKAETNYKTATETIAAAHAAGMPRPNFLQQYPLHLAMTVNHSPQVQMRPAAEERRLWENAQ